MGLEPLVTKRTHTHTLLMDLTLHISAVKAPLHTMQTRLNTHNVDAHIDALPLVCWGKFNMGKKNCMSDCVELEGNVAYHFFCILCFAVFLIF